MQIINNTRSRVFYGILDTNELFVSIQHPTKNLVTQYRGGGSLYDGGEHFTVYDEEDRPEDFCLIPNESEKYLFEGISFSTSNKESELIVFMKRQNLIEMRIIPFV